MRNKKSAPFGAAENEVEESWRIERVDMAITRIWFSGRKSRSVNNLSGSRILEVDGDCADFEKHKSVCLKESVFENA